MNNEEKLRQVFVDALGIKATQINSNLTYNTIPEWDSIGHMALVAEIDDAFDTMLDTDDVLELSTFSKAMEILTKYDIQF